MLQANANNIGIIKRRFDHQGNTMPAADTAEWLVLSYSIKIGASGYPDPGVPVRILD